MTKKLLFFLSLSLTAAMAHAQMDGNADTQSWTLLPATDGKMWYLSTESTYVNVGNQWYDDLRYQTQNVRVLNAAHEELGGFTIDVTGLQANDVSLFGPISQHLFNADDQWEVCVQIHIPGNAANGYKGRSLMRAYSLDGQLAFEGEGQGVLAGDGDDMRLILSSNKGDGLRGSTDYAIYQLDATSGTLAKAHTFTLSNSLTEYTCGPAIQPVTLSDGLHFILAHYEKPLPQLNNFGEPVYDPVTGLPDWTPDNYFVIENYGPDYQSVDELWIPTSLPEGMMARMMGIGVMSYQDITEGYFTADGRVNYIVTCEDTNQDWEDEYTFEVYAQGGDHVGTLFEHCGDYWSRLSPIAGEPDQWVFLSADPELGQQLTLVDASTLRPVTTIPSLLDGKMISASLDRMPDAIEGYKYVIALNEPSTNDAQDVISHFGIYHRDLAIDRYVSFNMGQDAETFQALVNGETLDPTLFCADPKHEFLFMTKKRGQRGGMFTTLFLGNEDGEILRTWSGEDTPYGDILRVAIVNYGTSQPELFIHYGDQANDTFHNEFIPLPLTFSGIRTLAASARSQHAFTLQGQRTEATTPGFYVRRGLKYSLSK